MKKAIICCFALALLAGCANQQHEDWMQAKPKRSDRQGSDNTSLPDSVPVVEREDGTLVPILAPVGFTEETILVKLTNTPDKPQFSLQDSMKNATTNLTQRNKVGFGKLQDDMDKDGYYAISLPQPAVDSWLHVTAGTEIDGKFKEGVLLDVFGNELAIKSLKFDFFSKKPANSSNYVANAPYLEVQSQASYARAQIMAPNAPTRGPDIRALPYGHDNFQLQLQVEAVVQDAIGYERTLRRRVYCGVKTSDLAPPGFNDMFPGY